MADGVFPIHADARSLPFAAEFFDAIVSIDSFFYYGTDDLYLNYLARYLKPGGQLVITSPYTWLEDFTPRENWLVPALDGLRTALRAHFDLVSTRDLPFLIREHARKFQWSVAQATIWIRR